MTAMICLPQDAANEQGCLTRTALTLTFVCFSNSETTDDPVN